MPSDKHMEAARALADNWALPETEETCAKAIAAALANAEREGMKRAAEKTRGLAAEVLKQSRNDIERCLANALETSANAILSEAGEKA